MAEFDHDYKDRTWKDYQQDGKLQKLMDRTVENILTALIEVSGTVLVEEGIKGDSYQDILMKAAELFSFSDKDRRVFAGLSIQRNRLAHRYPNYRWQAVKAYKEASDIINKFLMLVIEREREKEEIE
ncbi:MAG: hypothetical protein JRI71_03645 [Deltaproteobacteria bacterium]|nr:hypothetical protein [Deltaproteobacteria bacterium]